MVLFFKSCFQKALDRSQKYISQKWLLVKYLLYGVMVDLDVHIKGGHWAPERNTNCFCLASPSMRGLNPPERNSPLYPTTSPQHGPSPQQKLQQRENYFHYDDLLIGQLKKKATITSDSHQDWGGRRRLMKRKATQFPLVTDKVALSTKTTLGQRHSELYILECYKIVYSKNSF